MDKFVVDGINYCLRDMTTDEIREADLIYAETFSKAVRRGILTNREAIRLASNNGSWTQEDEDALMLLRKQLKEKEEELTKKETEEDKLACAMELRKLRAFFNVVSMRNNEILNNTAESIADAEKAKWMTFSMLADEKGNKLFKNYKDFLSSEKKEVIISLRRVLYRNAGLNPDVATPEEAVLKKSGKINDGGYLTDAEGKFVNEFGNYIDKRYRSVDKDGYLIDDEGKFVNENGNLVSECEKVKGDM